MVEAGGNAAALGVVGRRCAHHGGAMRKLHTIIVHCSATPADMDIGVAEIRRWHTDAPPKGNGWQDIGYHAVIRRDGTVEEGRPEAKQGAHCAAQNGNAGSLGVCMVGGCKRVPDGFDAKGKPKTKLVVDNNFTVAQFGALRRYIRAKTEKYGITRVIGHRDLEPRKACPSFSVKDKLLDWAIHEVTWV